jgi:tudor domain-containing protein 1/4/6/7
MSRRTQRAPIRIVDRNNGEWDEFDPRFNDYVDNFYTSGPRLHLPPNMPYAMRYVLYLSNSF